MSTWVSGLLSEMGDHLVDFDAIDAHLDECLDSPVHLRLPAGTRGQDVANKRSGIYRDKAAKAEFVAGGHGSRGRV